MPNILSENKVLTGHCGKKNIGPPETFKFDFEESEETHISITQIGRNITRINQLRLHMFNKNIIKSEISSNVLLNACNHQLSLKQCVDSFFDKLTENQDFFLYVAFHDPHRCGHTQPQFGNFCERFGNKDFGGKYGLIPDWTPQYVDPTKLPDKWNSQPKNSKTLSEIANRYTTISRMDDGISLILENLRNRNLLKNSMVLFASDNGPPFLRGRTNLYQFGIRTPLIISHPNFRNEKIRNSENRSILDVFPTILNWFEIALPDYKILRKSVIYTGKSLLPDFTARKKVRFDRKRDISKISY